MLEQYSDGGIFIKKPDTTNQSIFIYFKINFKKYTKQVKNNNAVLEFLLALFVTK